MLCTPYLQLQQQQYHMSTCETLCTSYSRVPTATEGLLDASGYGPSCLTARHQGMLAAYAIVDSSVLSAC